MIEAFIVSIYKLKLLIQTILRPGNVINLKGVSPNARLYEIVNSNISTTRGEPQELIVYGADKHDISTSTKAAK